MTKYQRSAEGEARRVAALRKPEVRATFRAIRIEQLKDPKVRMQIGDFARGKNPTHLSKNLLKAWAANRKEVLTYSGIHAWVKRTWGKANRCELCGKQNLTGHRVHWANKNHKYTRDRNEWMMVCRPCHAKYDQEHNGVSYRKLSHHD